MKELRAALRREEISDMSRKIGQRLMASSLLEKPTSVALYAAVRNEVETAEIFNLLKKKGCRLFFPRVTEERIEFVETGILESLRPGPWRIPEPPSGHAEPVGGIEAVLVPGLAFDEAGGRLGFGQGHYDRALENYGGCKIGLAYDFQVLSAIPRVGTDLVCDWIVTEKRVIRGVARKGQSWNHNSF